MRRTRKMTAKQKKLFLLTSMMSVFVMAAAVLFAGGKFSLSPLSVRGVTEQVEGSITWDWSGTERTKHANNKYTFLKKTQRGTPIYLYSYGQGNQGTNKIWSSKYNTTYSYGLFVSAEPESPSLFQFQSITSISIVTASTSDSGATFAIYGGGTDTTPLTSKTILSPGQTLAYTPSSTMTQFSINATNGYWVEIQSITVNYSCSYDGGGSDPGEKTLSSITISGQTDEFTVGDTFSFGGTVTAHYSDSTSSDVTASATFTGYDLSEEGEQTVTVSYTESGVTKTTSYEISVSSTDPSTITLSGRYNFTSRQVVTDGSTNWTSMYIEFNSNGTAVWYNSRTRNSRLVQCTVYLLYTVTNDGSKYSISVEKDMSKGIHSVKGYSFYDGEDPWDSASAWTGYGTDKPLDKGFVTAGTKNDTGELSLDMNTLKFSVFDSSHSYEVNSIFTFTLAS